MPNVDRFAFSVVWEIEVLKDEVKILKTG